MNRTHRIAIACLSILVAGCNTFAEADPYSDTVDSGQLDSGSNDAAVGSDGSMGSSDAAVDADLDAGEMDDTGSDAEMDGGTPGLTPIAIPGAGCAEEPQRQTISYLTQPSGPYRDDIALVGYEESASRYRGLVAYMDETTGAPLLTYVDLGSPTTPTSSVLQSRTATELFAPTLDSLVTSTITVGDGGEQSDPIVAISGNNCAADGDDDQSIGAWFVDIQGENGESAEFAACSGTAVDTYVSAMVGGQNPFTGLAPFPPTYVAANEEGFLAKDLTSPNTLTPFLLANTFQQDSWLRPTRGSLVLTANAQDQLIVWNATEPRNSPALLPDAFAEAADVPIPVQSGVLADLAYLTEDRYVLAHVRENTVYVESYVGDIVNDPIQHEFVIDALPAEGTVHAVAIAVFDGGFAVFRLFESSLSTGPEDAYSWIIQPYTVSGDTFVRSDCTERNDFVEIDVFDVERIAFSDADAVYILYGVNFSTGGQKRINVEGAFFGTL